VLKFKINRLDETNIKMNKKKQQKKND